jgi:hypothetical protein
VVFHIGATLQYSVIVFEKETHKVLPAQSVAFDLLASGKVVSLPSSRYKSSFWTGHIAVPSGLSGIARVRANVSAAGRRFTAVSYQFIIRGPVKTVSLGRSSSEGDNATATTTGTINRPADGYVLASAQTSPSQSVHMNWSVDCVRGAASSSKSGSDTDGGPGTVSGYLVIQKIPMSLPNADNCTVSFTAQLVGSGSIKIEVLGDSWR